MDKELTPLENWKPVKEYIEYCFGWRNYCEAITYTSTTQYLAPFIKGVEKTLEDAEKYRKVVEIIKEKRLDVNELIDLVHHKDKYLLLDEYNEHVFTNPITKEELDLFSEVL